MSKVVLLVVLFFVCAAFAATPERPNIPASFYAEVSVLVKEATRVLYGGGIHAFDTPKGFGREDYRLEDAQHQIEFLHLLQRYDLHTTYELLNGERECRKQHVNGTLQSPWEWIKNATYNGTVTHLGKPYDSWVSHFGTHGEVTREIFVDPKNVNVPVHTFVRSTFNKEHDEFGITYITFNTTVPSDWVFYIPRSCESTEEERAAGKLKDVNAVVYFANANWNCGDVPCSYRVPDGSDQPGYACAEFTARSLAAGGFMGSLGPYQMGYCGAATGYNLCSCASLNQYFADHGFHKQSTSPGAVNAAWAVIGDGGEGAMSHACIGIGPGTVDCHNIARQGHAASGSFYAGINVAWTPF